MPHTNSLKTPTKHRIQVAVYGTKTKLTEDQGPIRPKLFKTNGSVGSVFQLSANKGV